MNFSAGCQTAASNIVMAITVFLSLQLLTRLLYYTPIAILASIILSSLPGLIDFGEAYNIWKVDKLDFLACMGAFFGVLFASVEIGLLIAVSSCNTLSLSDSIYTMTKKWKEKKRRGIYSDREMKNLRKIQPFNLL